MFDISVKKMGSWPINRTPFIYNIPKYRLCQGFKMKIY